MQQLLKPEFGSFFDQKLNFGLFTYPIFLTPIIIAKKMPRNIYACSKIKLLHHLQLFDFINFSIICTTF